MADQSTRKQPAWLPFAVVGGAVIIVMILWSALSSPDNRPADMRETFTLTGKLVVPANVGSAVPDGGCIGDRGFSDIQPGAVVTVRSGSMMLASGTLASGQMESTRCAYAFTVPGVLRGQGTYQVEVGGRGAVEVDETTAVTGGVSLTLG